MAVFADEAEQLKQYNRLRRSVGASDAILTDPLAEEYFVEAQEMFPNNTAKMIAQASVIALQGIRASAALLGKYAQNQSSEDLTKVFDNLTDMLRDAEAKVEKVTDVVDPTEAQPFFFGVAQGQRGR